MRGVVAGDGQGNLRLLWPRRDQAWLAGLETGPQGIDPAWIRALLDEARGQGARMVRTVVPAGFGGGALEAAGLRPGPGWLTLIVADPSSLPSPAQAPAGAVSADPAYRARRISAGQWRNPRVRLAIQSAVERGLVDTGPAPGALGAFGLIAAGDDAFPLCAWGPFDLMDAIGSGEVVTAGDPARPAGVMLLREAAGEPGGRRVMIRFLGAAGPAAASLLAFAAVRAGSLPASRLEASLPLATGGELLAVLGRHPGVAVERWQVYGALAEPS